MEDTRAKIFFLSRLSSAQKRCFEKNGYFYARGKMTGRRYRIRYGHVRNISASWRGRNFCVQVNDELPVFDHMLAQKLAIELNEETFLKISN